MRPMGIDNVDFISAIRSYCVHVKHANDRLDFTVSSDGKEPENLSSIVKITLYRIIQEALSNIVKYANASKVIINISYLDNHTLLTIKDNGCGFDVNSINPNNDGKHGYGISNMKERVLLLGGKFTLESSPACGTFISADCPNS